MTIKQKEKKHFKIVKRQALTQETIEKIKKEYTDTYNTKIEAAAIACKKYDVSRTDCNKILSTINHKTKFKYKNNFTKKIEAQGGVDLIKALKKERWTLEEMCSYFKVSAPSLSKYLKKNNISSNELSFREKVTDEDANWVKKKYGIK